MRIDTVEFAGFDQRSDGRPMLAATIRAGEQRILTVQRNRSDATLHDVGVDLGTAVVEEAGETVPARERITDRLGEFCLLTDQGGLGPQPGFKVINNLPALVLANSTPLVGAEAADVLLDGVESCDAFKRLTGNRR